LSELVNEVDYNVFEVDMGQVSDWGLKVAEECVVKDQDFLKLDCDDAQVLIEIIHILHNYCGKLCVSKKLRKKLCLVAVFNSRSLAVAFANKYIELIYLTFK